MARATEGKAGRRSGFTLVELLVAIGVFALMYAGVHGLFTSTWSAWRRNRERAEAYQVGITLVDSILRDVRNARDAVGTSAGASGTDLRLVLNFPARRHAGGGFDQKRVTYERTTDGFKRTVQTSVTPTATAALSSGTPGPTQEWILSRSVTNFQFEQYATFTNISNPLYQRIIRFFITVQTGSGRVQLNGRAFIRRSQLNGNQDGFAYE